MSTINLTETVRFSIEPSDKKLRLVVLKNDKEWVCRKESHRHLERFLESEHSRLFKGRLQLVLNNNQIEIEVKGAAVGVIPVDYFRQTLATLPS